MTAFAAKIMFISFAVLAILGIYGVYYTYQVPEVQKSTFPLIEYQHTAVYDYTASLRSNLIYGKTTLGSGEGTLYLRITENLTVTFTYRFQSSIEANSTIAYSTKAYLRSAKWAKQLNSTKTEGTITGTEKQVEIPLKNVAFLSIATLESIANQIRQEMGVFATEYRVVITAEIQVLAETAEGTIDEAFNPTLEIIIKHGTADGDIIVVEGLETTKTGMISQEQIAYNYSLIIERSIYSVMTAGALGWLIWRLRGIRLTRTPKPQKYLNEIIEPYKEIIAEAAQTPDEKSAVTSLGVKSIEDLVKIADSMFKPIIHVQKGENGHLFYVIDGSTRYEYTITDY
ncbi:MAG: DUF5305 domain-containing protein [Candidatus Bathyarchaeota archaeon]|nr:DUF5305 domain-containing protein [Candidatus Bathyarchaeota archaeon]